MPMMNTIRGWFGRFGAIGEKQGQQAAVPSLALVENTRATGVDGALQLSAVWSCVDRRATTVSSLPLFVYRLQADGQKTMARTSRLYQLLHDSPNRRMTPMEFWRAMVMNHDLRGAAYARIDRDQSTGEAIALWPMPTDQVTPLVLLDGTMVYEYRIDSSVAVIADENVLVIKGLGNGTVGLDKLEFMRASVDEAAKAQQEAARMFGNGGKPTGVLMIDKVLSKEQRAALHERFGEMATGSTSRLYVLEANMKYEQLSLSPQDQQLLETRRFTVEEICRWFDVPPVLAHHSNVTTWGSGIHEIVDGWYKLAVRPMLVSIEQAIRKRVMTPAQRASLGAEFSLDALLRASLKDRAELYAKLVQNGLKTRNECRQLENDAPDPSPMANALTVQSNLVPLHLLGTVQPTGGSNAPAQNPVAQ